MVAAPRSPTDRGPSIPSRRSDPTRIQGVTMANKKSWLEGTYGKAVKKAPERRAKFETSSGIPVNPLYDAADVKPGLEERLGFPGEYPFARGVQSTMYRGRFWTMRQYAG